MEKQPSSRTCFLCGRQNEVSLKLTWYNDLQAQRVRATVTIPEHFNGYPGVVHGGIVAALLDETAGRAVLLDGSAEDLKVTLKLEVKYRQPTPTDVPVQLVGWMVKRSGSRAQAAAHLLLPDGSVAAEGEVLLASPPPEMSERWEAEKQYWRVYEE